MEKHTRSVRTRELQQRGINAQDYDDLVFVIAQTCHKLGIRPLRAVPMLHTLIAVIESDRVYQETGVEVQ